MKTHSWPVDHWQWPIPVSHYHGVRRGGFIYTGGQADLNKLGQVVHPDQLDSQTHRVVQHVQTILNDLDASLNDVVKLVVYFVGNESDEALILDIIASYLNADTRPVVSTICLPALCYPGMRIELEAVALDSHVQPKSTPGDVSAIQADGSLRGSGDVIEQTRIMMDNLKHALSLADTSLNNVLKLNVFYEGDGTSASWTEPARIRAAYFNDPGPAATGIAVTGFSRKGLKTKISATAANRVVTQPVKAPCIRYSWPEGHWNWTSSLPYKHGNRFGRVIHLGGQVALDVNAEVLHPNDIVEQTKIALENINTILLDLDASLDDVIKVTTFYQGNASAEALHENLSIRSNAFKSPGPATTGIPVPHLVYEKMLIEIEVIAIVP